MNQWIWLVLIAVGAVAVGAVVARGRGRSQGATSASKIAYNVPPRPVEPTLDDVMVVDSYNPKNVGNDASARPWESDRSPAPDTAVTVPGLPEGFDVDEFLQTSQSHFRGLQAAWNTGDTTALKSMMAPDFLAAIQAKLSEREAASGQQTQVSEVVTLDAKLLAVETAGEAYLASVEFNGMLRDEPGASPTPFREVWNITRPKDGGGWLVAGLQALH